MPTTEKFQRTWPQIQEVGEQLRHFNTLQSDYRRMVSTWLLAALAGVGFVYSDKVSLPLESDAVAAIICVAAAGGIGLLWILDVLVYHELLVTHDEIGHDLEKRCPWLPQVREKYSALHLGRPVRLNISLFYVGSISLLGIVAGLAVAHSIWKPHHQVCFAVAAFIGIVAIFSAVGSWMYRDAGRRRDQKVALRQA